MSREFIAFSCICVIWSVLSYVLGVYIGLMCKRNNLERDTNQSGYVSTKEIPKPSLFKIEVISTSEETMTVEAVMYNLSADSTVLQMVTRNGEVIGIPFHSIKRYKISNESDNK